MIHWEAFSGWNKLHRSLTVKVNIGIRYSTQEVSRSIPS